MLKIHVPPFTNKNMNIASKIDYHSNYVSDEGVSKIFTCARTLIGQYVFIQLVGVEGSLSLCEVEVFTTNGEYVDTFFTDGNLKFLKIKR